METDPRELEAQLAEIAGDAALLDPTNLDGRARAIAAVEWAEALVRLRGRWEDLSALRRRAGTLRGKLEGIDQALFDAYRVEIRSGALRGPALRARLDAFTRYRGERGLVHAGYDGLDLLVQGVFRLGRPPVRQRALERDMIQLELTPARAILELVDSVAMGPGDLFCDLGSGLGQVALLVHLLAGVPAKGVEMDPAYARFARERAAELRLSGVAFANVDARYADYSAVTVAFMFAPFVGGVLAQVLARLEREARARRLVVCSYGPSTAAVAAQPWLRPLGPTAAHPYALATFESGEFLDANSEDGKDQPFDPLHPKNLRPLSRR